MEEKKGGAAALGREEGKSSINKWWESPVP